MSGPGRAVEIDLQRQAEHATDQPSALADLLAEHIKECTSDHCAACDCGWDSDDFEHGPFAHADHLASVIAAHFVVTERADDLRNPPGQTGGAA